MLGPTPPVAGWPDLDAYAAVLRAEPPAINIAPLVGHGALRVDVVGTRAARCRRRAGDGRRPPGDGARAGCVRAVDRAHVRAVDVRHCHRAGRRGCGARPAPPPVRHHARYTAGCGMAPMEELIAAEPVHRGPRPVLAHRHHRAVDMGSGGRRLRPLRRRRHGRARCRLRPLPVRRFLVEPHPVPAGVGRTRRGRAMRRRLTDPDAHARPSSTWRPGGSAASRGTGMACGEPSTRPGAGGPYGRRARRRPRFEPAALMLDLCLAHGNELQVVLASRRADDVATFLAHPLATLGIGRFGAATRHRRRRATPTELGAHARLLGHYGVRLGLLTGRGRRWPR